MAGTAAPPPSAPAVEVTAPQLPGGIETLEEEALLNELNAWVGAHGLPEGHLAYELAHPESGRPLAILDLAWPNGLQVGLSQPVAVLLNEGTDLHKLANQCGYTYFTDAERFKTYVENYVLALARRLGPGT